MRRKLLHTLLIFSLSLTSLHPTAISAEPTVANFDTIENYGFSALDYEYEEVTVVENEVETVTEPAPEPIPEPVVEESRFTEDEIFLITWCMVGEAEGEPEEGKRLVIDVILNRIDSSRHPNTAYEVIYAKNQFEAMSNGRAERCKHKVTEEMIQLVREEIESRTNNRVLYFRTKHYHNFGTPEVHVGNHYFSS